MNKPEENIITPVEETEEEKGIRLDNLAKEKEEADKKFLAEQKEIEEKAKAEAERQEQEQLELLKKSQIPGVEAGSEPTSLVGMSKPLEKLLTDTSVPPPAAPIYKKSTLSGEDCIPCAFVFGQEILTFAEAKALYPDMVPADFVL